MGSAYNALKAEKTQLAADLEAAVNDLAGVKKALVDREKSLEESREANKALLAKVETMKREIRMDGPAEGDEHSVQSAGELRQRLGEEDGCSAWW